MGDVELPLDQLGHDLHLLFQMSKIIQLLFDLGDLTIESLVLYICFCFVAVVKHKQLLLAVLLHLYG